MDYVKITQATAADLPGIAALFDQYRQFYKQQSNVEAAREFLEQRVDGGESVIFFARVGSSPVGFCQLFPSFSSVAMQRIWILNDLFVAAEQRNKGVATALLTAATDFAKQDGAARLILSTATDNQAAKRLYEAQGWQLDTAFDHYQLQIT